MHRGIFWCLQMLAFVFPHADNRLASHLFSSAAEVLCFEVDSSLQIWPGKALGDVSSADGLIDFSGFLTAVCKHTWSRCRMETSGGVFTWLPVGKQPRRSRLASCAACRKWCWSDGIVLFPNLALCHLHRLHKISCYCII